MKKYYKKCPICNSKMSYDSYGIEHIICETNEECINCGYYEDFAYGYSKAGIKNFPDDSDYILHWGYNYRPSRKEKLRFKKAMWSYRKALLRNRKIKTLGDMRF